MRKRLLNPDLYRDEDLAGIPIEARYLYTGLWCIADREGRLEDRPMRIKADIFPYDDIGVSLVDQWLTILGQRWIIRYVIDGKQLIQIINFAKHQRCHRNEAQSTLPRFTTGAPMVDQGTSKGQPMGEGGSAKGCECTSVIGNRYTVIGKSNSLTPSLSLSERGADDLAQDLYDLWPENRVCSLKTTQDELVKILATSGPNLESDMDRILTNARSYIDELEDEQFCLGLRKWLAEGGWQKAGKPKKQWPPPGAIMEPW